MPPINIYPYIVIDAYTHIHVYLYKTLRRKRKAGPESMCDYRGAKGSLACQKGTQVPLKACPKAFREALKIAHLCVSDYIFPTLRFLKWKTLKYINVVCCLYQMFHPPNICLNFLAQFRIYSYCDQSCVAQVLSSHPNLSSPSGCGWMEYLNDFWLGNRFLEGSSRILKPSQIKCALNNLDLYRQ